MSALNLSAQARADFIWCESQLRAYGLTVRHMNCDCERTNDPTLLQTMYTRYDPAFLGLVDSAKRDGSGWIEELRRASSPGNPLCAVKAFSRLMLLMALSQYDHGVMQTFYSRMSKSRVRRRHYPLHGRSNRSDHNSARIYSSLRSRSVDSRYFRLNGRS